MLYKYSVQKGIKPHMQWYFMVRKKEEQISFRANDRANLYSHVASNLMCRSYLIQTSIFSCTKNIAKYICSFRGPFLKIKKNLN